MDLVVNYYTTTEGSTRRRINVEELCIIPRQIFLEEEDIDCIVIKYKDAERTSITYRKAPVSGVYNPKQDYRKTRKAS